MRVAVHRLLWLLALCWGLAGTAAPAGAQTMTDTADLLSVAQAFQPDARRAGRHTITVSWRIADGYYLYRHGFEFSLLNAGAARLGPPDIPDGEKHADEYFGPVETYRHHVRIGLPIEGTLPDSARLRVSYQGCADAGLCYPPQTRTLSIDPEPAIRADAGPPGTGPVPGGRTPDDIAAAASMAAQATKPVTTASSMDAGGSLADRLAHAPTPATLALFVALGVGLAFTPCILPMIPIVAGLIGSRHVTRGRAMTLTLAYVLAMASAYTVFGVVAGYFGANLQAALQRPLVLLPFAGLFGLLAAASFGWFELQLPTALQARVSRLGQGRDNGRRGIAGAAALGFASALIAGPCLAPPLAGALLYISTSGNYLVGGAALFCLGLGMGLPLIALAAFGSRALPRAGAWMSEINVFFGVLLAAVGLWLALRLAPSVVGLAAWGGLALVYAAYLSTRTIRRTTIRVAQRVVIAVLVGYAALAAAGLAIGDGRPDAPLAGLKTGPSRAPHTDLFTRVTDRAGLERALAAARRAGRPAVVDFYADWCVECVQMRHTVFGTPRVRAALGGVAAIEFDVTDYTADQRDTMRALGVFGPPTLLFHDRHGRPVPDARLVGRTDTAGFLARLAAARNAGR